MLMKCFHMIIIIINIKFNHSPYDKNKEIFKKFFLYYENTKCEVKVEKTETLIKLCPIPAKIERFLECY